VKIPVSVSTRKISCNFTRILTLFHLSGILSTENDHLLLSEVDSDRGRRGHAAGVPVGGESAAVVDGVVGVEVLELFSRGTNQHVAHEQSMVGASADNAHADPVALVPAGEAIDDVDALAGVEVVNGTLTVDAPDLGGVSSCRIYF
jgi:hypothetical protein